MILAKTSIQWGIFLGFALVAGTQILTWMGLGLTSWFVIITYLLLIVFIGLGSIKIKALKGGNLDFKTAALSVLLIVLASRIIFQLYMFIYVYYIDPQWIETTAKSWSSTMMESGKTKEQIDQTIEIFRQAYQPFRMFTVEVLFYGVPQFILGLIVSSFFVFRRIRK